MHAVAESAAVRPPVKRETHAIPWSGVRQEAAIIDRLVRTCDMFVRMIVRFDHFPCIFGTACVPSGHLSLNERL